VIKRISLLIAAALFVVALSAPVALAAPLPDNCTKQQGTVTCTTFEGPGNNQAGVGSTSTEQGQGNPDNTSPAPQDLQSGCSSNPPKSQGAPNSC
jgi:hypothetical protein